MYHPKLESYADRLPDELLPLQETLAEHIHDGWAAGRLSEGWRYGPTLDEILRTHPSLIPYKQLPEAEKEYDRRTAAVTISCILENGYHIEPTR